VRQKITVTPDVKVLYRFPNGSPAIISKTLGSGTVTYSSASLNPESYSRLLETLYDSAKITRPLRVHSNSPVEARYATLGSRRLLYVTNFRNTPAEVTVGDIQSMQELRSGLTIHGNGVTVPAKQTLILEVF